MGRDGVRNSDDVLLLYAGYLEAINIKPLAT